ncbi:hypothetical protein [Actinokineospora spheciospongiae]|uniref:hypothetical protein n=1 Tax=Actinokineospora spheciospongiae TaxID=909613 RepID=UPI000DA07181|nr:hypothetical protein [Actinokineospora spheciospongiae]PWW50264.1 hypothetical protein DFQ13_12326 [Actinokineospora spheciospongiae]
MTVHQRRIKMIQFTLESVAYECQVQSWKLDPGIEDGERQYTQCPDGTFIEETDDDPSLELKFFSDFRSAGIDSYLWANRGRVVDFQLDHHPEITGEHVRWSGTLIVKPGPAGGEARATETTEVTMQIVTLNEMERIG